MSRFLWFGASAALLLLAVASAVSASSSEELGRAAEAIVDAGVPGVAVYVRDKDRTTSSRVATFRPLGLEQSNLLTSPTNEAPAQRDESPRGPRQRASRFAPRTRPLSPAASVQPRLGPHRRHPGYKTTAFSSGDGAHQVVFMINSDSDSLTAAQGNALNTLLNVAYCG